MADFQVIVIGSGAGGLSSALFLAKQGYSTLLLEAMPSFGGYLNPFRRGPYSFDTGLHYLGQLGKEEGFAELLETLGIADKIDFVELNPEGFDRYVFPDYEISLCKGKEQYKEKLIREFPGEQGGIEKYFRLLDRVTKALGNSTTGTRGFLGTLGFLIRHPVMLKYGRATYQKLLDDVTKDKLLQTVLSAHSGTYGLPPSRASALVPLMVLDHYLQGAYYPKGGSGAFRDAFVDALTSHGVHTKRLARVVDIDKRADDFIIITEAGERYTAKSVVSNADPALTLGQLVNSKMVPPKMHQKAMHLRPSVGAFYAFIGTDLDLPSCGITDANIYHYHDIDFDRMYETGETSSPKEALSGFFLTSPSVKDPEGGHAPQGKHTLEIVTMMGHERFGKWADTPSMKRGQDYEDFKNQIGERLVKAAEIYIPDLSNHLDHVEYATPLSNAYWVNAVRGGCYGPEETPDQMGPGRFSDFTTGVAGLFLVGAGTLGGGIMTCVASGVLAGNKAAAYLQSSR